LRWKNPRGGGTYLIQTYTKAEAQIFIDGKKPDSAKPHLNPGRHILALHFTNIPPAPKGRFFQWQPLSPPGIFLFSLVYDSKPGADKKIKVFVSAADGTWRYTTRPPTDDSWLQEEYNDREWHPMTRVALAKPPKDEPGGYMFHRAWRAGARPLGIPEAATEIWVRRTFELRLS